MPLINFKEYAHEELKRLTLTLFVTRKCNLRCSYCYEQASGRDDSQMDFSTARDVITHYMERDDGHENVSIEFFGGEPLLVFPLVKEIVEWFYSRSWKKRAYFGLQTNATLLTPEIKDWLAKYAKKVIVGFSIDGCKEAHDLNRNNSYDLIFASLPFLKKHWPYQPAKFTINDKTIPYLAQSVMHLENLNLNFNGGLVLEDIWGDDERKKELLEIYEDQLAILVDFYALRPGLYPPAPLFAELPEYLGRSNPGIEQLKNESCRFCGAGYEMVTIDVDGTPFPCHRFLPICTGRPLPDGPVNRQAHWEPEKCARCKLSPSCPTCIGFNYQVNGAAAKRTTHHCEAFKLGIMASCKLEALRLTQMKDAEVDALSADEKNNRCRRLDAIIQIVENGL